MDMVQSFPVPCPACRPVRRELLVQLPVLVHPVRNPLVQASQHQVLQVRVLPRLDEHSEFEVTARFLGYLALPNVESNFFLE